ncbi:MAG: mechanosensitive ion channel family protein [Erysipelotrichaceae bacterium]
MFITFATKDTLNFFSTDFLSDLFNNGLWIYLLTVGLMIIAVIITLKLIQKLFLKFTKNHDYQYNLLYKLIKVVLYSIVIFVAVLNVKPLSAMMVSLLASAGVAVVALSLLAQEAAGNLIAGIMITSFRPFIVNDFVSIEGQGITGTVTDISLRHTTIRTLQNTRVIVPNAIMNTAVLENKKVTDGKYCTYILLNVGYDSDLLKVKKCITKAISSHPSYKDMRTKKEKEEKRDKVPIYFTDFGESGIKVRVSLWTKGLVDGWEAASDCRVSIKKEFDKAGIVIPYKIVEVRNGKV